MPSILSPRSWLDLPLFYRLWQRPFVDQKTAPFRRRQDLTRPLRVLEVGCGPGTNAPLFANCDYLGLDLNPRYIEAARQKYWGCFEVADATQFDAGESGTFDCVFMNSLLHHLDDESVRRLFAQLRGVLGPHGRIHVLDLVLPERPSLSRWLAQADRGDFPRPLSQWRSLFAEAFTVEVCEPYSVGWCGVAFWSMVYLKGRVSS